MMRSDRPRAVAGRSRLRRATFVGLATLALSLPSTKALGDEHQLDDLKALSFEELLDLQVTSVSKREQKRSNAAAAITVLTGEEIRRAGHRSIPEALRMVPGLQVARIDSSNWAISARGFNQQFANKLLVLIDGRSVYTPLFAGVYWDIQDVLLEDVDRIEVIRGPGGTLWGANAVNGVINVITKSASETRGLHATGGGGSLNRGFAGLRWGGGHEDVDYRVYAKGKRISHTEATEVGGNAQDDWWTGRAGFRTDWRASDADEVTVQGDYYQGEVTSRSPGIVLEEGDVEGGNLLARWTRHFDEASALQTQAYYDRSDRDQPGLDEERDTLDVESQYDRNLSEAFHVTIGAGYRLHLDRLRATGQTVRILPERSRNHLVSGFLHGEWRLFEGKLVLSGGTKLEYNDYSGFEYQPSLRAAWIPSDRFTLWAAVSRAVRTPSQADEGIRVTIPLPNPPNTLLLIRGQNDFRPEELLSAEVGLRGSPTASVQIDVATFLAHYESITTNEPGAPIIVPGAPPTTLLPSDLANRAEALTWGLETEIVWQPIERLRLSAAYTYLGFEIDRSPSSSDTFIEDRENASPTHQLVLRSRLDLPHDFEVDASVYFVDDLPSQNTPNGRSVGAYWRGDLRIAHRFDEHLELAVVGQNLFDRRHAEFGSSTIASAYIPRSVYAQLRFDY